MTPIQWNTIVANMRITAEPVGLWTPVFEYLPAGTMVRILAEGAWAYSAQVAQCGADGHRASFISPRNCLTKDALVGALICKVGGGTGDVKGTIFPSGSQTMFTVPPEAGGGLFMTINDEMAGFDDNSGYMTVSVAVRLVGTQAAGS
jgi:PA-IL-like protein